MKTLIMGAGMIGRFNAPPLAEAGQDSHIAGARPRLSTHRPR